MRVKFPRTYHLPFSQGVGSDDKIISKLDYLVGQEVVVTEKMDGENTTLYCDYIHARSIDSRNHPSRNWVKQFHASISHNIPAGYRVCGENLYAKHSVEYHNLESYFYGFSVWDSRNVALSWDNTVEWFSLLGINCVPVLYRGEFDMNVLSNIAETLDKQTSEGFVVRSTGEIPYDQYQVLVAKWVRANHVQTTQHWQHSAIVPNRLKL